MLTNTEYDGPSQDGCGMNQQIYSKSKPGVANEMGGFKPRA